MPPGHARTKTPVKIIEQATGMACTAIARQVQRSRSLSGDTVGPEAAQQVARAIEEELLKVR